MSQLNSVKDLIDYYEQTGDEKNLLVGIEWERSGVYADTLEPVKYEGDKGYLAVLKKLVSEVGWEIIDGHRNYIFELKRGNARVTLEADGRLELAGSPLNNLHDLAREFRLHANEVKEMSDFLNIGWLPLGLQPFHSDDEIDFIDKKRYRIFMDFAKNDLMEMTMKRNNGLTVNFSYSGEKNAIKKAQVAFRIMPIVGAMFASSPFNTGKISKYLDGRRHCIFNYEPERNAAPRNILNDDFSFEEWFDFYLKKEVYLIKRRGKDDLMPKNLTFYDWMKNGYENTYPKMEDFDQHVKTTWGDIRLRPAYLEYRVADSVPFKMAMSVPALIKGLVFDSQNWDAVLDLTKDWTYEEIIEADKKAWSEGLNVEIKGKSLLWYAKALVHIANEALHRFNRTTASNDEDDESVYLAPLKEQVYIKEKSIAREIVDLWEKEWEQNPKRLLDWCNQEM